MNHSVKQLSIRHFHVAILTIAGCITSLPAYAGDHQNLLAIHASIVAFVSAQHGANTNPAEGRLNGDLQVRPDSIDARLRLTPCQAPLRAFWAPGSKTVGNTTVGVRCDGQRPWKLFIPTRVLLMRPVVIANRALIPGQHLAASDLRIEKRDIGSLRGNAIGDPEQVLGYMVKRAMAPGRVLDTAMLQAPVLVERDRRVRMAVRAQGINISMSGQAMEDGALGETVKVRNTSSGAVVEGVVTGPGTVRLHLAGTFVKPL